MPSTSVPIQWTLVAFVVVTAIAQLLTGLLVLWRARGLPGRKAFVWMAGCYAVWTASFGVLCVTRDEEVARGVIRWLFYTGLIPAQAFFLHFAMEVTDFGGRLLTRKTGRALEYTAYGLALVALITEYGGWLVARSPQFVRVYGFFFPQRGPAYDVFTVGWIVTGILAVIVLLTGLIRARTDALKRARLFWITVATATAAVGGGGNAMVVNGSDTFPFGFVTFAVGNALVAFALTREFGALHKWARAIAWGVVLALAPAAVYVVVTFLYGGQSAVRLSYVFAVAVAVVFFAPRLGSLVERLVDRGLGIRPEVREALTALSRTVTRATSAAEIADTVLESLVADIPTIDRAFLARPNSMRKLEIFGAWPRGASGASLDPVLTLLAQDLSGRSERREGLPTTASTEPGAAALAVAAKRARVPYAGELWCQRQLVAVLLLQSTVGDAPWAPLTAEDRRLLELIEDRTAAALLAAQQYEELQARYRTFAAVLNWATKDSRMGLDVRRLLSSAASAVAEALGADDCAIFRYDQKSGQLLLEGAYGPSEARVDTPVALPGDSLTAAAFSVTRRLRLSGEQARRHPGWAGELKLVGQDGSLEVRAYHALPMRAEGRTMGVLRVLNQRQTTGQLAEDDEVLLDSVAGHVAERLAALVMEAQLRAAREARLREREELHYRTAHKIGNEAFGLWGLVSALPELAKLDPPDPELLDETMRDATAAYEQMKQTIVQLKHLAKAERLDTSPTDLNALVQEVVQDVGALAGVQFRVSCDPTLPRFSVDRTKLRDALLELIQNAVAWLVAAKQPAPTVEVRTRANAGGREVDLEIADNGPGIPADRKDWIFESFRTTRGDGSGLGLTIVRQVVEAHGGTIRECGTPGEGATFVLTLSGAVSEDRAETTTNTDSRPLVATRTDEEAGKVTSHGQGPGG